ncbi:hypothetical protein DL768_006807 [Monosporascus sp. mg162]|nr:hypothetical protein DL768_006807 [Monosporascus sp. mg162]
MSIQKLGAALVAPTVEANVGLATLNVDFSLVKLEAPTEFKPLGHELTVTRRMKAEDGMPHVTARKLGALFQHWIPRTPHLIRAYGSRAVEISKCRAVNPKASKADGVFAEHVGIDGTSIWAAATSGPHAIPIHLLACLLARVWSGPEAIAIWAELVSERKKELSAIDQMDPLYEQSQHISRISIPRHDLAEWDASARSWLQAGDRAMESKQKQLMLIVNNVDVPVSTDPVLLQNVRGVWESSMVAIDKLIQGMAQSVESGAVLLGLTSWHIYPDILVLGKSPTPVQVKQRDALVSPGGILTVGLHIETSSHHGVYWSLPLAHLRYYGGAVMAEKSLDTQGNRIAILQLFQVAVGSLTRDWPVDREQIGAFFGQLWEYVSSIAHKHTDCRTLYWLGSLAQAMEPLQDRCGDSLERKQCLQLMSYGSRRCPGFLTPRSIVPPFFGVNNLTTFLSFLNSEDDGVEILRQFAQGRANKGIASIIRYTYGTGSRTEYKLNYEYATVFPVARHAQKRRADGESLEATGHVRWVVTMVNYVYDETRLRFCEDRVETGLPVEWEGIEILTSGDSQLESFRWNKPPRMLADGLAEFDEGFLDVLLHDSASLFGKNSVEDGESVDWGHIDFRFVAGDPNRVALFESISEEDSHSAHAKAFTHTVDLSVITRPQFRFSAFPMDIGKTFACIALFESGSCSVNPDSLRNVMAMATGDSIYIAAALLCDPMETPEPHEVRRIRGNIGKPGIAMLIPPKEIQDKHSSPDWRVVNHNRYNGKTEDSFQSTSLHLRFTDYTLPIDIGLHGLRDFEIYFLESVVSVHDRGRWVADIDILGVLDSPLLHRVYLDQCHHDPLMAIEQELIENPRLTTIDDWNEILDSSGKASIARAANNWLGRLATVAYSVHQGHPTIVLPSRFCWTCVCDVWDTIPIALRARQKRKIETHGVYEAINESLLKEPVGFSDDGTTTSMAALEVASWDTVAEKWKWELHERSELPEAPVERPGTNTVLAKMADLIMIC